MMQKRIVALIAILISGLLVGEGLMAASSVNGTNVKVMVVQPKKMKIYKSYIGHLKPLDRVVVKSETSGTVEKITFKEGQRVNRNQVLVHVSTNELELRKSIAQTNYNQAVSDYQIENKLYFKADNSSANRKQLEHVSLKQLRLQVQMAKADYDLALNEYNIQKNLFEKKMASSNTYDSYKTSLEIKRVKLEKAQLELEQAKVKDLARLDNYSNVMRINEANLALAELELEKSKVTAPFSGIVKEKIVQMGGFIDKGSSLVEIMDISKLLARVNIPENEMRFAHVGKEVTVKFDALPGEKFNGKIRTLGLEADLKCRCFPAEVVIDNNEQKLLPGMMSRVTMLTKSGSNQVVVPRHAVLETNRGSVVFVERNGVAVRIPVETGDMIKTDVQITKGLRMGDKLIVVGQDLLTNNERVNVVNANQKLVKRFSN